MAKYGKSLAQVVVEINGKQQVQQVLKAMEESAEKLRAKIDQTKKELEELAKGGTSPEYTKKLNDLKQLEAEEKQINRSLSETKKLNLDINDVLANMSEYTATTLAQTRRKIEATLRLMKPVTEEQRQQMQDMLQDVRTLSDEINRRMGKLTEFEDIMNKITHVDDRSLDAVTKRLKDLIATTDKLDSENLIKYTEQLSEAEDEKRRRILDEGKKTLIRNQSSTYRPTTEMAQADIKVLEEYKKLLRTDDTEGLEKTNKVIDRLKQNIKETESGFMSFEKAMEKAQGIMAGTFNPTLDDLEKIQKVLKEGMQDKFHIANPEDEAQLKKTLGLMEDIRKKQQEVMRLNHQDKVNAVSKDLYKVSPAEIEEAVKAAKELQQVAKSKEEFIQLGEFIGKAEARLKDWNETAKQSVMKSQIKDLSAIRALSDGALQDQLKFWEGTMDAAKKTSQAYKDAKKNFEDLQAESKRRLQFEGEKTIKDVNLGIGDGSTKQMQERLKLLQDYRAVIDGTKPDAYKAVDEAILKLTEDIKASQAGFLSFDDALKKAQGVMDGTFKPTLEDLEKIQKVLKEGMQSKFNLVDDADIDKLKETRRLMDEMAKKQAEADRIRLQDQAQEIMGGSYTKTIEGTKQAIELLKKYQDTLDTTNPDAINDVADAIKKMNTELETAARQNAEKVMANPFRFSLGEISEAIKYTEKLQASVDDLDAYHNLQLQIERAKKARDEFAENSKHEIMVAQFGKLEKLSVNAYAEQKKYWEAMRDSGQYYSEAISNLEKMAELEQKRLKKDADKVMAGQYEKTIEGTKQAIELLKKYQQTLDITDPDSINDITDSIKKMNIELDAANRKYAQEILSVPTAYSPAEIDEAIKLAEKMQSEVTGPNAQKQWNDLALQIDNARKVRDEYVSGGKFEIMNKQFQDFDNLSKSAAAEQKKYWEGLADSMAKTDPRYQTVLDNIKKIKDSEKQALADKAADIIGGTYDKTIEGTKQAIELLKKYQQTLDSSDTDGINNITDAIREMNAELDTAVKKNARETLTTNLETAGAADIKQSVEWLTKYRDTLEPLTDEWKEVNKEIADGNVRLKILNDTAKAEIMTKQLSSIGKLSKSALAEQKKFWQAMIDGAEKGSDELKEYSRNLELVSKQQNIAARREGRSLTSDVLKGTWKGTIGEAKEAIKALKEYKETLDTTDTNAIKRVDAAIEGLTNKTKIAEAGIKDIGSTLNLLLKQTNKLGNGSYKGSVAGLELMLKRLTAIRDVQGQVLNPKDRDKLEKAISNVNKELSIVKGEAVDVNHVLGSLKDTPLWKLEKAAKQLQEEIRDCSETTGDFAKKAAELRRVNAQIDSLKKKFKDTDNVILRTAKRLASYILVYAGWNEVWGQIKNLTRANLELSDSLADIQKTTGLSAQEVGKLSDQINAIDTRTAQKELHDLAYEAGKLGISAEEDVMAFVKAGNQLLVALGEDLGGAEAVRSLMKVNAILGETEKLGVEKALLSTGSAINEISQTSRASAGPIADMVSRMGAIGAAAGLSMADLIALAGTADSLGQSAEVAATAFNKFISTLKSNPVDVAFALGMDSDEVQRQLDMGNTMTVIQQIFEKMSTMGDMESLAPIMGELGSEGARMTQVLVTMAKGVGELNAQLYTSRKAFKDATSVTNEYNIKNESAAAIVQRMGNNLREAFVQSSFVDWLKDVLQWLYYLPKRIEESTAALLAWKVLLWEVVMVTGAKFVSFLKVNIVSAYKAVVQAIQMAIAAQAELKWGAQATAMLQTASALGKLKLAFQGLWVVVKANPFTALMSVLGLVIGLYQTFCKETSLLDDAKSELNTTIQNEQRSLRDLRTRIDKANSATGERAALIKQLNDKYGSYLGFLVTESNYIQQQAYIYDLLNAKIRENVALKMEEKMTDKIIEDHAAGKMDANETIQTALQSIRTIGEGGAPLAMEKIFSGIAEQVEQGGDNVESILRSVIGGLSETLQAELQQVYDDQASGKITNSVAIQRVAEIGRQGDAIANLRKGIKDALDVEKKMSEDIDNAHQIIEANQRAMQKRSEDITRKHLEDQFKNLKSDASVEQLQTLKTQTDNYIKQQQAIVDTLSEKKEALSGLSYEEERRYNDLTKQIYGTAEANDEVTKREHETLVVTKDMQDEWDRLNAKKNKTVELSKEEETALANATAEIKKWGEALKPVNSKLIDLNGINIWGTPDEKALAMNSPQQLVNMWDKLEADAKRLSSASFENIGEFIEKDGKKMATQFWRNFDTREKATQWYIEQKNAIAAQLKKLGYSTSGNFLTSSSEDGDSEQRAQARRDYQASMSALEAYYKEYEDFIRQKRADMKITEEEMNRQILNNDRKFNEDRQQLIKKFLGDENSFDKTKYVGILSNYDYFKDKDLEKMAAQYQRWGDAMTDGGRNQIAKSGVAIRKALNKEQEKIKAELLKGDMFATFENNFAEMLDELGVLTSNLEDWADETLNAYSKANGKEEVFGMSPEERQERIHELVEFADQSYQVNADGLRRLMMQNTEFANWAKYLTDEQMNVLLLKLRGYYDDRLALTKRHQEQMKKEFEAFYEQSGQQNSYDRQKQSIDKSTAYQSGLEEYGVRPDYDKNRENIAKQTNLDLKKKDSEIDYYGEQWAAANDKLAKAASDGNEEQLRVAQSEMQAAWDAMAQAEIERNELLAQSQRDLTQVYMDEWAKRAERWGQWGEMFGEYLGEQVMLEKQANDARARGDLETAKKIEQQQKQNKQALIQNLLSKIVDEAALWAKEYALKMMFNSLMLAEDKKKAIEEATLQGKSSMLSILLNALTGQSKEHAKGIPGLVTGAIIFAATMALQAFAKSAIANMFPEAATESTGNRKLSTGMLTYAEGNYPVLGNDGKVYDAKYEGAGMKTGVYGGGAHFGIFSEKQPEMIVDGKTTQKLILNYPYIYDAITTIAKNGRLKNAMPTFATGDYPAGMKQLAPIAEVDASAGGNNEQMERMSAALEQNSVAFNQLTKLLQGGITAHLDGLETHRQQKKNERFLKRRGID